MARCPSDTKPKSEYPLLHLWHPSRIPTRSACTQGTHPCPRRAHGYPRSRWEPSAQHCPRPCRPSERPPAPPAQSVLSAHSVLCTVQTKRKLRDPATSPCRRKLREHTGPTAAQQGRQAQPRTRAARGARPPLPPPTPRPQARCPPGRPSGLTCAQGTVKSSLLGLW